MRRKMPPPLFVHPLKIGMLEQPCHPRKARRSLGRRLWLLKSVGANEFTILHGGIQYRVAGAKSRFYWQLGTGNRQLI
jgi:hypothetical protein